MKNPDELMAWLKSALRVWPRGGKKLFADTLGVKPANFSHLTSKGSFCAKTMKCMSAAKNLHDDNFDDEDFPVESTDLVDGILWNHRKGPAGQTFYTWRMPDDE